MNRSFIWNSNTGPEVNPNPQSPSGRGGPSTPLDGCAWGRRVLIVFLALVVTVTAAAPLRAAKVTEHWARIFKDGQEFEPTRIGIDEFTLKDSEEFRPEDAEITELIGRVVYRDLDFSYLFDPVRSDTLYLRIMGSAVMDRRAWRHLGAEYLIVAEAELSDDEVAVSYELRDILNDRRVFSRRLKTRRSNARQLGHVLSDEVYQALAKTKGIFQSRLAYLHGERDYHEVHVADYDGANDLAVTADRVVVVTPRWAGPNAVSYTSYLDGNPDVWILDLSRDRARKLSARPGLNSGCTWSRDGKRYVLSLSIDGDPEIYLGKAKSGNPRRITFSKGIDSSPSFSPDGKKIVFTSDRGGSPQIYIMDDDGANVERLTFAGNYNESPDWSPTLDLIAYVSRQNGLFQINTCRPDGSGVKQLTEVGSNENPHWSPDGLHLVFSSNRTGTYEIYTMNYDGTGVRRITHTGNNKNPSWSP